MNVDTQKRVLKDPESEENHGKSQFAVVKPPGNEVQNGPNGAHFGAFSSKRNESERESGQKRPQPEFRRPDRKRVEASRALPESDRRASRGELGACADPCRWRADSS